MDKKLERIRELQGRAGELTTAECDELAGLIVEVFDKNDALGDKGDPALDAELTTVAAQVTDRRATLQADAAAAAEARAKAKEQIAQIRASDTEATGDGDGGNADTDGDADADADAGTGDADADAETVTAIAASGGATTRPRVPSAAGMNAGRGTSTPRPPTTALQPVALVAAGRESLTGFRLDAPLSTRADIGSAMARAAVEVFRATEGSRTIVREKVATMDWSDRYPAERRLGTDPERNGQMIENLLGGLVHEEELVATGGICAPPTIDYSIPTYLSAERPVRDALAQVEASRGGIIVRQPIDIGAAVNAVTLWSEATDANPGGSVKGVLQIACQAPATTYTGAVVTQLEMGNMLSRFDPETMANWVDTAMGATAQTADRNLLSLIAGLAVADVQMPAVNIGASRQFFAGLYRLAANYRNIHRLPDSQVLTAILPRWFKDVIRSDRAQELAHDSQGVDPFMISDDWIESVFAVAKIRPVWSLDGLPVDGEVYPAQDFVAFTASAVAPSYPVSVVMHLFVEGSVGFLDGGRLDLGIVRDTITNATNDATMFSETFEGVFNRGWTTNVLQVVIPVCASGTSAATLDNHSNCL